MNKVDNIKRFARTMIGIRQRGSTSVAVAGLKSAPLDAILIVHNEAEARRIISHYGLPPHTVRSMNSHLDGIRCPVLIDKTAVEIVLSTLLSEIEGKDNLISRLTDENRMFRRKISGIREILGDLNYGELY